MNFCSQLPNFEIISEVSKFSELEYNDIDYNLPNQVSNKFYSMGDLQKLKNSKNLSILTYFNINKAMITTSQRPSQKEVLLSTLETN